VRHPAPHPRQRRAVGHGRDPSRDPQDAQLARQRRRHGAGRAIACATGNTARVYTLDVGVIATGRAADLVMCDAPTGSVARDALEALSAGDIPGISMVLIDGTITIGRSRNTAPAARAGQVLKGRGPGVGSH